MSLSDDVRFNSVQSCVRGGSFEQVLRNLCWAVTRETDIPYDSVSATIKQIARRPNTGIGGGIAVLDWMSEDLSEPYVLLARLETPVDVDAVDERPADFVLVLISPATKSVVHLRHLSRLTRLFRDESFLERLRATSCSDGLMSVLLDEHSIARAA